MAYIETAHEDKPDCVFCSIPSDEPERVLANSGAVYAVLNRFPYNPGHVLVVPVRHVGDLGGLTQEESVELHAMIARSVRAISEESEPQGFNVGLNIGRGAGAGIPDHLHWHVVPRWSGDTNYMTVVGETRVLPELLADTYRRLAPRFGSTES
jgi:ATP adenylyltransferase